MSEGALRCRHHYYVSHLAAEAEGVDLAQVLELPELGGGEPLAEQPEVFHLRVCSVECDARDGVRWGCGEKISR